MRSKGLLKSWSSKTSLTTDEILLLHDLLKQGLPLSLALDYFKELKNVESTISSGGKIKGNFFSNNPKISKNIDFFLGFTTLEVALCSAMTLYLQEREFTKSIIEKLLYPCVLLFSSIVLLLFFTFKISPMLQSTLSYEPSFIFNLLQNIFLIVFYCLSVWSIVIFCQSIGYYRKKTKKEKKDYLLKTRITKHVYSYLFAKHFILFQSLHLSFQQSIYLMSNHPSLMISEVSKEIHEGIKKGVPLLESFTSSTVFTKSFLRYFIYGNDISNIQKALSLYVEGVEKMTLYRLNKFTLILQIFSYSTCIYTVLMIYQALLTPLQMLEHM